MRRPVTLIVAVFCFFLLAAPSLAMACTSDVDCTASEWCRASSGTCQAKLTNGSPIPNDPGHTPSLVGMCGPTTGAIVCASGVCDGSDNSCGFADFGGICTSGNAGVVCRSGACSASGVCMPAGGCAADIDCSASQWCNVSGGGVCTAKIANGGAIPNDPAHGNPTLDGTCSFYAAGAACASGVCDFSDDECGYADGHGSCTQVDGGTVCRSTACSQSGACKPAGGCLVEADCPSGNVCTSQACVPLVATPTPVPTATPNGFVAPDKDTLNCENAVAKSLIKLGTCIRTCRLKNATAASKGKPFDLAACETTPGKSCRAKYDAASQKLIDKGICPSCLDGAQQAALADHVVEEAQGDTRDLYCAGSTPLPE